MDYFFQANRPTYVKMPFNASGRDYKVDDIFRWEYHKVPVSTVKTLFENDFLKHSDQLEESTEEVKVGDGLNELSIVELQNLVLRLNAKVKDKTKNITEYNRKKVASSKLKDKQIGLIRRWRLSHGEIE